MKVSDGSFFWISHALSFEPNLYWARNSPLMKHHMFSSYSLNAECLLHYLTEAALVWVQIKLRIAVPFNIFKTFQFVLILYNQ